MATYPATNSKEASELLVDGSNQVHEIVNGDALTEVTTESGPVPTVRKALSDTFLFVEPVAWNQGSDETAFNQLRTFGDETYWAPTATLTNPIAMGATPVGDNNWRLAPTGKNESIIKQWDTEAQENLLPSGSSLFKGDDGVYLKNGDTVPTGTTHILVLLDGKTTIVAISPVASGTVSSLTEINASIGGQLTFFSSWSSREVNEVPINEFLINSNSHLSVAPHPAANNPVLTKDDVTDRTAQGVADPFICHENGKYHMFFEVITADAEEIGHAESIDGLNWTYTGVVVTELGQHFAYPFVMKHKGEWYMIPDKGTNLDVYIATNFPSTWVEHKTLITGAAVDATIFKYKDYWYMHVKQGSVVNLYYTDDWLDGVWQPHPNNPMLNGVYDRGAGRAFVYDDSVVLPIQGFGTRYGEWADWYVLTNLSPTTFDIQISSRIFNPHLNGKWNSSGMHHIDHVVGSDQRIMAADGIAGLSANDWSIGIYTDGCGESYPIMGSVYATNPQSITANTWTPLTVIGNTGGKVSYDTNYMWSQGDSDYTINKTGYYRINAQLMEYGVTGYRNIRASIYDKTNGAEIVYCNETVPSEAFSSHGTTIQLSRTVYIEEGTKIDFRFFSTINTNIDGQYSKTFFELEFVGG